MISFSVVGSILLFLAMQYVTARECGLRRSQNRIVGGKTAYLGQFPWIARVYPLDGPGFVCSGTIIAPRFVLTAARCTIWEVEMIRAGDNFSKYDPSDPPDCEGNVCAPQSQDIDVRRYFKHPHYHYDQIGHYHVNDIAILELISDIEFNEFVQPACLLDSGKKVTGMVEVAGWGEINDFGTKLDHLQYVTLKVESFDTCRLVTEINEWHIDRTYCVGNFDGRGVCYGDTGGPMTKEFSSRGKRVNYLVGIISTSPTPCGSAPAIYIDVAYYRNWINDIVWSDNWRSINSSPAIYTDVAYYRNWIKDIVWSDDWRSIKSFFKHLLE